MNESLPFTGERFVPGIEGEIVYEHVHRYAFARRYATGSLVEYRSKLGWRDSRERL